MEGVCWVKERIATCCQYINVRGWECWLAAWLVQTPDQQQSSCTVCDSETTDHWTLQCSETSHHRLEVEHSRDILSENFVVSLVSISISLYRHDQDVMVKVSLCLGTGVGCGESLFPNGPIAQWGVGGWSRRVKCLVTLTVLVCC